jgi:hypothetical protein
MLVFQAAISQDTFEEKATATDTGSVDMRYEREGSVVTSKVEKPAPKR